MNESQLGLARPAHLLVPVWGEEYIKKWTQLSLPSMLAPGNLPALARRLPTRLVMLSDQKSYEFFRKQPVFDQLAGNVEIDFIDISDLIGTGPYSVVITRAFARGMFGKSVQNPTETAFVLLVSDFVFADGSLDTLGKKISEGHRAIFHGNFGAIEEDVEPILRERVADQTLAVPTRELVQIGIQHMHPVTGARFLDQQVVRHSYPNRFFWHIPGAQSFIGRFFLLHPLCLVPEVVPASLQGFADYYLFPAAVPSRKFTVLDNSDEFFILESEPYLHEFKGVNLGAFEDKALADHLSYWITPEHFRFPEHPIVYRAEDVDPELLKLENRKFGERIERIRRLIHVHERSFEKHPYWEGATNGQTSLPIDAEGAVKREEPTPLQLGSWVKDRKGKAPFLKIWQPHWPDFECLRRMIPSLEGRGFYYHASGTNMADEFFCHFPGARHIRFVDNDRTYGRMRLLKDADASTEPGACHLYYLLPYEMSVLHGLADKIARNPLDRFIIFCIAEDERPPFEIGAMNQEALDFALRLEPWRRQSAHSWYSPPGLKTWIVRLRQLMRKELTLWQKYSYRLLLYLGMGVQFARNLLLAAGLLPGAGRSSRKNYVIFFDLPGKQAIPGVASEVRPPTHKEAGFSLLTR